MDVPIDFVVLSDTMFVHFQELAVELEQVGVQLTVAVLTDAAIACQSVRDNSRH